MEKLSTGQWVQASGEFAGLPVYRCRDPRGWSGRELWYTPGLLALLPPEADEGLIHEAGDRLRGAAVQAQRRWEDFFAAPYAPLALTLYLHNTCPLGCAYCFTTGKDRPGVKLSPAQVLPAAQAVAENCRRAGQSFQVIFHGGGEPAHSRRQVDALLAALEPVAQAAGVQLSTYIATNGVFSAQKAAWLAARFDQIGLSCDGGAAVQAAQRPTRAGANSLPYVERTARILREAGKPFHVRMTVTPASLPQLEESVAYICRVLRPAEINIEPVYASPNNQRPEFRPAQAADLLIAYRQARQAVAALGVRVETSGARLFDIHGPYCNLLRPVLNLLPDGSATACFKLTESAPADRRWLGPVQAGLVHLVEQVQALRQNLRANLDACATCFNALHCARDCPDGCLLDRPVGQGAFRCAFNQALAEAALWELAHRGMAEGQIFMREEVKR